MDLIQILDSLIRTDRRQGNAHEAASLAGLRNLLATGQYKAAHRRYQGLSSYCQSALPLLLRKVCEEEPQASWEGRAVEQIAADIRLREMLGEARRVREEIQAQAKKLDGALSFLEGGITGLQEMLAAAPARKVPGRGKR